MVFVMLPNTVFLSLFLFCAIQTVHAQTGPPITSSGFNTNVTSNGGTYNITGGTRPGGGESLFHSFGEFSVPTNHIANFLNDSGLSTSNILGRVTGNNPSSIFGTIQTTGFGNALIAFEAVVLLATRTVRTSDNLLLPSKSALFNR